jgi:uncharacterized membrane protein YfcA
MTGLGATGLLAAGVAAGTINAVVGSGTLITFPALLALGYPPLVANVSNTLGLVPGAFSGAYGYRRELEGQRARLLRLGPASTLGGLVGAGLLLVLPASAFDAIVPVLVALACVLVVVQPKLTRRLQSRPGGRTGMERLLPLGVFATGIYGGYFGAAQGVLLIALLGICLDEGLQRLNAAKNVLAGLVNGVAAVVFVFAADVAWVPVLLLAAGSMVGGQIGARVGRSLPAPVLRGVVVAIGLLAIVKLLTD